MFVVILVLSVISTYILSIAESVWSGSLLGGSAGLPLKFASGTMFGNAHTNYLTLALDIAFWFLVIWGIWKIFLKRSKKSKE